MGAPKSSTAPVPIEPADTNQPMSIRLDLNASRLKPAGLAQSQHRRRRDDVAGAAAPQPGAG
jgi:hypothetical protein